MEPTAATLKELKTAEAHSVVEAGFGLVIVHAATAIVRELTAIRAKLDDIETALMAQD